MDICIIHGSIRQHSNSEHVVAALQRAAEHNNMRSTPVTLQSFSTLFTGDYISLETATPEQRLQLLRIIEAPVLLFVVPTYYKSMPGALKNFFDSVRCQQMYAHKVIGFVASNHKNQDYGARHAEEVVKGLLTFFQCPAVLLPEIVILNHEQLQKEAVDRVIHWFQRYLPSSQQHSHTEPQVPSLTVPLITT
jgi:NAD(P)H-dependent FMN reductase